MSRRWIIKGEDVLKRIIGLNAGRFRLLIQLDEILHDAQRFVPDRIGLRGRLFGVRVVIVRIDGNLILLPIEGNRPQFRGRQVVKGKFVSLRFQRRPPGLPFLFPLFLSFFVLDQLLAANLLIKRNRILGDFITNPGAYPPWCNRIPGLQRRERPIALSIG